MKKYEVRIAVDVPYYADVEIEANSKEEAMNLAERNLEKYYEDYDNWDPSWQASEDLRVVDAVEV